MQWWFRRRASVSASDAGEEADDVVTHPIRARAAPFQVPSLASATRDYAHAVDTGTFSRLDERDLTRLSISMGPDIWAWEYALRLTGQTPWRAGWNEKEPVARTRAARQMASDIATWERALAEVDAEADRARAYGKPAPAPLIVPADIQAVIEARRQAALERATRRRVRASDDGGSSPVCAPDGGVPHPPGP